MKFEIKKQKEIDTHEWREYVIDIELHELWPEVRRSIVTVRKPHKCNYCSRDIIKGEIARCDTGLVPDDTRLQSFYVCFDCIQDVINEHNYIKTEGEG